MRAPVASNRPASSGRLRARQPLDGVDRARSSARCAGRSRARCASTHGSRALYAHGRLELPPVRPSAWSFRAAVDDVVADGADLPRARRAAAAARRRHQPGRPVLQRGGRDRLLQVPEPAARDRSRRGGARASSPASCSTSCAQRGRSARAHLRPDPATHNRCTLGGMIGNNSCGIHSVMARVHGPGARTADNVEALDVAHLRRRAHARRRDAATRSCERDHRGGRPRGRDLPPRCARCATATPTAIRDALPGHPAARLAATTWTSCCRRTASTWRGPWSAPRAPA